ncbi:condensin subunit Smc [Kaistia soli DSM 19436]|uniref:Chromosome partition protein Smc n=1 Tax=Kaistia soli DSM 19436 TaxID=1122133 RepID=A0A1M4VSI3_9HYPH|nr:chromosome segregation protein SMC [Kaistia soli]SHE71800.1 condensin subunit Smc [Kaistia soli DSM 19436]
MRFTRLRLVGFKSFVDASDFVIEPGLTGVVGPNGCGKSNLVEALRWVMGESSYKNMRASGMDDVIFSGSGNRPARNTAEVMLAIDNSARTAPAAFNDADMLEVTRRIEREAGSVYRINGREVRARDVQLLFADASTGARSPAMVGQGRIGELISAKPQARRAILEEAAGISGLYSRRNEAETRLKAAEQNLERLDDVLGEIEGQIEALRRQARQANRYRNLSGDIRKAEALALYLRLTAATAQMREGEAQLAAATAKVGERSDVQTGAARDQAVAASALPAARENEAKAAAALQRLGMERNGIEAEERRMRERLADLERRLKDLAADIAREEKLQRENAGMMEALDAEEARLRGEEEQSVTLGVAAEARRSAAETAMGEAERRLGEATAAHAALAARRAELERAVKTAEERLARAKAEQAGVARDEAALAAEIARLPGLAAAEEAVAAAESARSAADARVTTSERQLAEAREREGAARTPLTEAERTHSGIESEMRALEKILAAGIRSGRRPPILDALQVERGFEAALAAAFGDDLDLSDDPAAAAHWAGAETADADPLLPTGARPLAAHVEAPALLQRALAQTGIVNRSEGAALQARLKTGQRLVSREGDVWRWDGFVATAEAPTAAAIRLANRNRLAELQSEIGAARKSVMDGRATLEAALAATRMAGDVERISREAARNAQKSLDEARTRLAAAEREQGRLAARRAAVSEARSRVDAALRDAEGAREVAGAALAAADDPSAAAERCNQLRAVLAERRAAHTEARAATESLIREGELRRRRLAAIGTERGNWQARAANAATQMESLASRRAALEIERTKLLESPADFEVRRRAVVFEIGKAEIVRREAAEKLAAAERQQTLADTAARDALTALSEAREQRGRAEERLKASEERRGEIEARIAETLDCEPHEVAKIAELDPAAPLPELDQVDKRLERLRQEREKLGGVNLRAEDEVNENLSRRDKLTTDRDDLIEAIRRLRQGIGSLNREGRERLLAAFAVVNAEFQRLFTHLFGGGTAELQLTESDDPLEAGLEIMARPPGKKPQTMTLLSGGEQALTAMALIFAVFLTNPAPICVLDEVDAPLDDHNVERFCNLLDEMARTTDTRFVTITHNPITMARMNRLFGVTMAERGVSQLVSVDLETAERFLEAS